jgi:RNase P/RNase MRP subunit p29
MRGHVLQVLSTLCVSTVLTGPVQAQQNLPVAPSAQTAQNNDHTVEGVVVSVTPDTLVIRSGDNQYHLFTSHGSGDAKVNDRVRVHGGEADVDGTRAADNVNVLHIIEGTVVSTTPETLVVRSDENRYHLFTYSPNVVHNESVTSGARVRVEGSVPGPNGTRVADHVTLVQPGEASVAGTTQTTAAPASSTPPPSSATEAHVSATQAHGGSGAQDTPAGPVNPTSLKIEAEARKLHVGGRVGFGLDPELVLFGPEARFGPFFSSRLMFQPNLEFGFGELTDMYAVNGDVAFHLSKTYNAWIPYVGMGPSFNFVNRAASNGETSFSDFQFKTGLNIFAGAQRRKMFVEMKTNLWASETPTFRVYVGYTF